MVIAVLSPEIAMLVAVLVAKVTMKLSVISARQSIGVGVGMLFVDGIVLVVMLVAQLLVLRSVPPVAWIPAILSVCHRRYGNAKGQP